MDPILDLKCKYCHQLITADEYFCPNCGKKIKDKPPATGVGEQIKIYVIAILLWPFGLVYVWRYLKQPEAKSKLIGWAVLVLSIIIGIIVVWTARGFMNELKQQLDAAYGGLL